MLYKETVLYSVIRATIVDLMNVHTLRSVHCVLYRMFNTI